MVAPIQSHSEFMELINGDKPVLVDFWATWCGPCKMISPVFDALSKKPEFAGIEFRKVDTDEQADIAQEVGITAMPTFMLFQNGNKIEDFKGAHPQKLTELVERAGKLVAA